MKNRRYLRRRGNTIVLVVLLSLMLLSLAAFAINISYVEAVAAKAQFVNDAASRAAGRAFAESGNQTEALNAANRVAQLNTIAGNKKLSYLPSDMDFGTSGRTNGNEAFQFNQGSTGNSIVLTTKNFAGGAGSAPMVVFPFMGSPEIRPFVSSVNTQMCSDIALVVDKSGSMSLPASATSSQTRWDATKESIDMFLDELILTPGIQPKTSLSLYESTSSVTSHLSFNLNQIPAELNENSPGGGTNIGAGMDSGMSALTNNSTRRHYAAGVMVLLCDGENNSGVTPDPMTIATQAAEKNVVVYTIMFGTNGDPDLMRAIANKTGGKYYPANSPQELTQAFKSIAHNIPSILTQ